MAKRKVTHYQILGVQPYVTSQEIKKAYRKLVKSLHPDVDFSEQSSHQRSAATQRMIELNEAYETLKDKEKRAAYDTEIGAVNRNHRGRAPVLDENDTEEAREKYLRTVFHPARSAIVKILGKYKDRLQQLSQDIYDDILVAEFEEYVDLVEETLRKSSTALTNAVAPRSLNPAVQMMRYSIAQSADGLEEMRRFCQNYDYDHLSMAGNLFRIGIDLSKKALQLTKI